MYRYPFQLLLWATSCSMGFVGCIIEKLRSCSFSFFSLFVPTFLDVWKPYPPSILNSIRPAPLPMLYSKASLPGARHILQSSNPLHAHFNVNFFLIFRTTETCLLPTNCVIYCFVRRQCLCVEHRITTSNVCSKNMCTLTEKQLVLNI